MLLTSSLLPWLLFGAAMTRSVWDAATRGEFLDPIAGFAKNAQRARPSACSSFSKHGLSSYYGAAYGLRL